MNIKRKMLPALLLLLLPGGTKAQNDDVGVWYSVALEKKISKQLSVGTEAEFRTRNNSKTADRWSIGADVDYKLAKGLRLSAGYVLMADNFKEGISRHTDGSYNNWTPSYWGPRHRFHADVVGSLDLGRFSLSLRERWQYTYRPAKETTRYDFDNEWWEPKTVRARGKNVMRSRLQVEYDIPGVKLDPYVSAEMFNAWAIKKMRYTVGADWRVKKAHTLGLYYRYQTVNDGDEDNEPNSHIIGLSYKYKF